MIRLGRRFIRALSQRDREGGVLVFLGNTFRGMETLNASRLLRLHLRVLTVSCRVMEGTVDLNGFLVAEIRRVNRETASLGRRVLPLTCVTRVIVIRRGRLR